tara:strand:+ start:448 stop:576 length:129 start_codon:yes stop_codon:yes gene_type:complete
MKFGILNAIRNASKYKEAPKVFARTMSLANPPILDKRVIEDI